MWTPVAALSLSLSLPLPLPLSISFILFLSVEKLDSTEKSYKETKKKNVDDQVTFIDIVHGEKLISAAMTARSARQVRAVRSQFPLVEVDSLLSRRS